ncbi:hypothetical protein OE647_19760 [Defluviimonas sp. WL0075]|uniref:Uncharacterized protein n=1 Tax=Albidovulum sediminicola TaxID=2984331 RepID=A0ABT2Z724_9RHOB|nr:hypothetical protein [Defluviimonas sp. WL0075]
MYDKLELCVASAQSCELGHWPLEINKALATQEEIKQPAIDVITAYCHLANSRMVLPVLADT